MGLFDFLRGLFSRGERVDCPNCGAADARKTRDGTVRCKNPKCTYFDASLMLGRRIAPVPTEGDFRPEHPVPIRYVNFVGQSRDFSAERDSLVRKRNHIVAQVAPTGRKIALSRDRIQNLGEIEAYLPHKLEAGQNWPSGRERQILTYHKKHGTTSPQYEQVRAKYPNW